MLGIEARAAAVPARRASCPIPIEAERLIDGRVKAIVLVTPNNPTGAVYPPETIAAFAELCRRSGSGWSLDETYRDFLAAKASGRTSLFGDPAGGIRVIGLYSFSKSYCVPGHRLGAITAGEARHRGDRQGAGLRPDLPRAGGPDGGRLGHRRAGDWREGNRQEIAARAAAFRRRDRAGARLADGLDRAPISPMSRIRSRACRRTAWPRARRAARRAGAARRLFRPGQERHLRIAFANADRAAIALVPDRLRVSRPSASPCCRPDRRERGLTKA